MRRSLHASRNLAALLLAGCLLATMTGCGDHLGILNYWMNGVMPQPAKFDRLEGRRVAVVCLDGNSLSGPSDDADRIAKAVALTLRTKVPDIQMVTPAEIADWMDTQDQDLTDYRDVGRGVKADMVVGIDLISFSVHEGQTLLKGRSKVGVKVFDMQKGGEVVYETPPREIAWPESGARHVTEDEGNFRTTYLYILAERIARDFYAYEAIDDVAIDAKNLAN
jgi:hypothetical protein